ncbi:nuclear transport factor 2 family protein [Algoriphagus mannitolivorans]|uniref:nuclear transport factor 2 family protein n=1 Tax=Algoriphagus mannitolivorans TaxID=226504 RepID=UPI0003FBBC15|nr:nuclear transport factor 2 family protein [Algoriphagus mannitolivorans]
MKKISFLIILLFSLKAQAQDLSDVTQTIHFYFEGMMERNREKLDQAFIPEAKLIGYRGAELFITPYEEWARATSKGEPRDPKLYINEIKGIRIVGTMALAETELHWPGIRYYDFLTLIKVEGKWKIVHKSWHETPQ